MKLIIDAPDEIVKKGFEGPLTDEERQILIRAIGNGILYEEPQGEYKIACDVLLSLEQIVRNSDSWEDSAVEAVHNAVQTAIKCIRKRPQGDIRWTDKLSVKSNGDIINLEGRVVGHINLEDIEGGAV